MSKNKLVLGGLIAALLASCASLPQNISAASIDETPYQGWSCARVGAERARVDDDLALASYAQRRARRFDTIGVVLVGLPVASIFGAGHGREIAELKGQQIALRRRSNAATCMGAAPTRTGDSADAPLSQPLQSDGSRMR